MPESISEEPQQHDTSNSWEEFDRKREADLEAYKDEFGSVEYLSRAHNEYFVHATNPLIKGGVANPRMKSNVDWVGKLAVLAVKHPTISASSIRPGTADGTWNRLGVILKSGRVEAASGRDIASYVVDMNTKESVRPPAKRPPGWTFTEERIYKDGIEHALRHPSGYNEYFIGNNPDFAGIFIRPDSLQTPRGKDAYDWTYETELFVGGHGKDRKSIPYREIFDVAEKFGMSVFVFSRNMAHRASLNDDATLSLGEEVSPEKMLEERYEVLEENRAAIIELANNSLVPEALAA